MQPRQKKPEPLKAVKYRPWGIIVKEIEKPFRALGGSRSRKPPFFKSGCIFEILTFLSVKLRRKAAFLPSGEKSFRMKILQYRGRKGLGPRFPTHHRPYRYHTHRRLNQHSNTNRIHKKTRFLLFFEIQKIIRKQLLDGNF